MLLQLILAEVFQLNELLLGQLMVFVLTLAILLDIVPINVLDEVVSVWNLRSQQ